MIEAQIKEYVSLASQYNIGDIVIAEMGRLNHDQEVRFPFFFSSFFLVFLSYHACSVLRSMCVLRVELC